MIKVKVSELSGLALTWAVATIEFPKGAFGGEAEHYSGNRNERWTRIPDKENRTWILAQYATSWEQGGLIVERECITLHHYPAFSSQVESLPARWCAGMDHTVGGLTYRMEQYGSTALIAAMRCYVAVNLGLEVEIPSEFF